MKIDITNYEEFFLLYIDNELSVTQKAAVESFLQENPVYQKELSLLQQLVLEPATIEYEDKTLLYRFDALEARLPIDFKKTLYRTETPIVKGFFTKGRMRALSAVAALLLVMIGYKYAIKVPEQPVVQLNTIASLKAHNSTKNITSSTATSPAAIQYSNSISVKNIQENKKEILKLKPEAIVVIAPETTTNSLASIEKMEQPTAVQNVSIPNNTSNSIVATDPTESFEELNTENPDRVIYVANLEIDGDKLRGITRRVAAFLRRNKTEKEK